MGAPKKHQKRWLISRMKTAGSRRTHLRNGSYADERAPLRAAVLEDLPTKVPFGATGKFYNGKIRYGLLVRFLRG